MKKMLIKIGVAFLVLLGLLLLNQHKVKKEEQKGEEETKSKKLFTLKFDSIHQVTIQSPKGKVVLERRTNNDKGEHQDEFAFLDKEILLNSDWLVTQPYRDVADRSFVQALENNLGNLESNKTVSDDGKNAADYGLAEPRALVELFEKGKQAAAWTLKVGGENTAGTNFYAQTAGSPKIVLIDKAIDYNTSKAPKDWRSKNILNFKDVRTVQKIQVQYASPSASYEFVRGEQGWSMTKPKKLPASEMVVDGLLREINGLMLKDVPSEDEKKDAAKYGLTAPSVKISTFEKDGQNPKIFLVGKVDEKAGSAYVARTGMNRVYEVVPTIKESLTKTLEQFINKNAFYLNESDVDAIQITEGNQVIDVVKVDDRWVQAKDKANVAAKTFSGVFKVKNLTALDYIGEKYGKLLSKNPAMVLTVKAKDKAETLSLFAELPKKENYIGRVEKTGLYYRFAGKDISAIQDAVKDLLEQPKAEGFSQNQSAGSSNK